MEFNLWHLYLSTVVWLRLRKLYKARWLSGWNVKNNFFFQRFLIFNSTLGKEAEIRKQMQWQKVACKAGSHVLIIIITKANICRFHFSKLVDVSWLTILKCFCSDDAILHTGALKPGTPVQRRTVAGFTCDQVHMLELEGDADRFGKQEDGAAGLRQQVQVELHGVWRLRLQVFTKSSDSSPPLGLLCSIRPTAPPPSQLWASPAFKQWRHFKVTEAVTAEHSDLWPRGQPDVL